MTHTNAAAADRVTRAGQALEAIPVARDMLGAFLRDPGADAGHALIRRAYVLLGGNPPPPRSEDGRFGLGERGA